ncbi:hypothetical protein C8R44DRAFT_892279 [Mycena epipterygia]|nr:hypothetical protein C8R44DRAFT_892279 [Mycena epipterygia]
MDISPLIPLVLKLPTLSSKRRITRYHESADVDELLWCARCRHAERGSQGDAQTLRQLRSSSVPPSASQTDLLLVLCVAARNSKTPTNVARIAASVPSAHLLSSKAKICLSPGAAFLNNGAYYGRFPAPRVHQGSRPPPRRGCSSARCSRDATRHGNPAPFVAFSRINAHPALLAFIPPFGPPRPLPRPPLVFCTRKQVVSPLHHHPRSVSRASHDPPPPDAHLVHNRVTEESGRVSQASSSQRRDLPATLTELLAGAYKPQRAHVAYDQAFLLELPEHPPCRRHHPFRAPRRSPVASSGSFACAAHAAPRSVYNQDAGVSCTAPFHPRAFSPSFRVPQPMSSILRGRVPGPPLRCPHCVLEPLPPALHANFPAVLMLVAFHPRLPHCALIKRAPRLVNIICPVPKPPRGRGKRLRLLARAPAPAFSSPSAAPSSAGASWPLSASASVSHHAARSARLVLEHPASAAHLLDPVLLPRRCAVTEIHAPFSVSRDSRVAEVPSSSSSCYSPFVPLLLPAPTRGERIPLVVRGPTWDSRPRGGVHDGAGILEARHDRAAQPVGA